MIRGNRRPQKGKTMLQQDTAYLLKSQLNPFPVAGTLVLSDEGRLSFTLGEAAAGAALGWVEKATGEKDLKDRLKAGERPVVFDLAIAGRKISWPKTLGNYGMKFDGDDRTWIVSLNYPSGGGIWQLVNMVNSKGTSKPWKDAFAAAGAK
jgi:hypothetical protein